MRKIAIAQPNRNMKITKTTAPLLPRLAVFVGDIVGVGVGDAEDKSAGALYKNVYEPWSGASPEASRV
jgi:hypothetical protein